MGKNIGWDHVIFIILLMALLLTVKNDLDRYGALQKETKKLSDMIENETEKGRYLSKRNKNLSGAAEIEMIARQRLGLIKSGETAYKIID
jgi:cell division protein FtsB